MQEYAHQHGMLDDIGKAAGMEGVAIVQPRKALPPTAHGRHHDLVAMPI